MTLSTERGFVVITGASTGIGAATAHEMARRGFYVLAGVRRERDADAIRRSNVEPLILDITNTDHIRALAARVRADPQRRPVRALVNNAAVQANVPVEVFGIDQWRDMFEVNLFGHVAVIQALLPSLIDSRGRVVNISSVGGRIAMATYGPYAGSKFALEAMSDSLRREVALHGVQVVVIEPGAVRTEMLGRAVAGARDLVAAMTPEQRHRYGGLLHAVNAQAEASTRSGLPAEAAATVIAKAITARKPRTRYTVGREAAFLPLIRLLPDRLLDRLLAAALRPYLPKDITPGSTPEPAHHERVRPVDACAAQLKAIDNGGAPLDFRSRSAGNVRALGGRYAAPPRGRDVS